MRRSPALAALALAPLLLVGCSGGSNDTDSAAQGVSQSEARGDAGTALTDGSGTLVGEGAQDSGATVEAGAAGGTNAAPAPVSAPLAVPIGQAGPGAALIRTGELEVVVEDVRAAADDAARLVRDGGGRLEAEERSSHGANSGASLRLRVPPEAFDSTLSGLAALGEERSRRLGSENVTEQLADLDSRLATQRASVERVRALLSEADNLGEVVQIEGELTRRTADLESLQARLAALNAQVDLSSISLRLIAEDAPEAAEDGPLGFTDGLRNGWEALTALGRAAGVTAGAVLPFTPLLAAAGFLLWRGRARRTA